MAEICCICLDPPKKANPLYHLSCGCNVALFHKSCETQWIQSLSALTPIKCLVCKREPNLKDNYSFSYDTGENQRLLWQCMALFSLELPLGIYFNTWVIAAEGTTIILFPFIFPCARPHIFFVLHYIFSTTIYLIVAYATSFQLNSHDLILVRLVHIISMFFSINCMNRVNPLSSYIISRDVSYARIIDLHEPSPKPMAPSLKRNKRGRRSRR
jgi:hypothetical protein